MYGIGLDGRATVVREGKRPRTLRTKADFADMSTFDRLPKIVRDALQDTVQKWTAQAARDALNQGVPPFELARFIRTMDADKAKKENLYGHA